MVKYLIGIIVLIFLFSTTSFFSFAQTANSKRESRNDRKEKKVDEIYQIETSNINSLPFAEEFHLRYEKYLKESIRKQQKAALADALFAFGEGLQGHTANQNVMASPKFKDERRKIYEDWINEIKLRSELISKTEPSSSKNDIEYSSKDKNTTNNHVANELAETFANSQTLNIYGGDDHDVFLGCLNCDDYNSNSIWNEYGTYGNSYDSDCIWNEYGTYGDEYSQYSPWNDYATNPPVIVDNEGNFYGYFTTNENKDQRADFDLVLILYKYYDLIREDISKWHDKIFE